MSNPYQSPQVGSPIVSSFAGGDSREYLRDVARRQRKVLLAVGLNFLVNIIAAAANASESAPLILGMAVLAIGVAIFSMVAMFQLANRVYGMGAAIVCTILMLVPCISLITLLVVNQKATSILQAAGVKVGLLGADPAAI